MSNTLTIFPEDIIHHIKLSCQIPEIVEAIAFQKVIYKAASEAGITVTPEELQQEGDRLRVAKKLVKAQDTWAWLKKYHLSLDDFEELARSNVVSQKLAHHLFANKVEHYFYEHQLDYIAAATYEVVLEDRDLALELFYELQEGEITFQEVARQYIQQPDLRRAGGYQGTRRRTDFRPDIAAAVFAVSPPKILKPIVTPKGFHLIWVEEIIQPQLDEELRSAIQQQLLFGWLRQKLETLKLLTLLDSDTHPQASEDVLMQA